MGETDKNKVFCVCFRGDDAEVFINNVVGLTHGRVVGVGETLVHPLPHEHPAVVGEGALDDLVVVLFQLLRGLCRQR